MRKTLLLAAGSALLAGVAGAQGADNCANAQAIAGLGPHAFNNVGATTDSGSCTTINSNVWFAWTAPTTDSYIVSTCSQTTLDTKIAVWDGLACPPTASLGCNDDACGLQTEVQFAATAGNMYLIEVGSWSSTTQGSGTFDFTVYVDPCAGFGDDGFEDNDDCASAASVGDGSYGGLKVYKGGVDTDWYTTNVADGSTVIIDVLFIDANGDIDVQLWDACGGNLLDGSYSVSDNEQVTWTNTTGGAVNVAWEVYVWGGSSIECNDYSMDVAGGGPGGPGTNYCTANNNSTGAPATITATGSNSVSANNLDLDAQPVPDQPGIFFYGDNQIDIAFGNGRLCASGGIVRLGVVVAAGNVATQNVDTIGLGLANGDSKNFQFWYRDPAAGGANFNTSDAVNIVFTP